MDLITLLNNTASALSTIQAKAASTSNNIANANTPGYAHLLRREYFGAIWQLGVKGSF